MENQRPDCYLILSLDGGGVRGALQARVLDLIEQSLPFIDKVQLIAGSSIGGVNGLCVAAGHAPSDLVKMYSSRTKDIFRNRDWWDRISGPADELYRADYDSYGMAEVVSSMLGKKTLAELDKKVVITSFDLDNQDARSRSTAARVYQRRFWKPKIFHNFESDGGDGSELAVDIALRTSAAPTLFPSYQGFIDGGIVANNPSMCAIGRAVKSGVPLDRIVMISIGTGTTPIYVEGDKLDWGLKQWVPKLLPLVMDGMVGIPDYVCEQLLPSRYVRIHPFLPEDVDLDDAGRVDDLISWADDVDLQGAIELLASLPA